MPRKPLKIKNLTNKKKTLKNKKKSLKKMPTGFAKVVRWSANDSSNFCHQQINGNDVTPFLDAATTFGLNSVVANSELTALYDNFRITLVKYRWVITRNPDQIATTANKGIYPRLVWCHDFNDQQNVSRNILYQRSNMREVFFNDQYQKTKWYTLRPSTLTQMYESAVATAYKPTWGAWLDTSDVATPHYGIKYSITDLYGGVNIRLEAKIYMEFKGIS